MAVASTLYGPFFAHRPVSFAGATQKSVYPQFLPGSFFFFFILVISGSDDLTPLDDRIKALLLFPTFVTPFFSFFWLLSFHFYGSLIASWFLQHLFLLDEMAPLSRNSPYLDFSYRFLKIYETSTYLFL